MSEINIDNFEDGQYEMDDSSYTDEDNVRINERIEKIIRRNTEKHKTKSKPMNFKNLTIENLKRDAKNITFNKNDSYIIAYPEFIKYFETNSPIEKHHLIIGGHFVYGWMPTILKLKLDNIDKVLELLNEVKNGKVLNKDELETLKTCINNSMVGLSKLLHFINPENYAIWDRRILKYCTGKSSQYGIDKPINYIAYIDKLHEIRTEQNFKDLHQSIQKHFIPLGYEVTAMRAIEIVMFQTSKRKSA